MICGMTSIIITIISYRRDTEESECHLHESAYYVSIIPYIPWTNPTNLTYELTRLDTDKMSTHWPISTTFLSRSVSATKRRRNNNLRRVMSLCPPPSTKAHWKRYKETPEPTAKLTNRLPRVILLSAKQFDSRGIRASVLLCSRVAPKYTTSHQ